jgi:hypothetical protein
MDDKADHIGYPGAAGNPAGAPEAKPASLGAGSAALADALAADLYVWMEDRCLGDDMYPRFLMPSEEQLRELLVRLLPLHGSTASPLTLR